MGRGADAHAMILRDSLCAQRAKDLLRGFHGEEHPVQPLERSRRLGGALVEVPGFGLGEPHDYFMA